MILHVWMHWFWITVFFKYFLFLAVQMISLSCISHPFATGAGLLENETLPLDNLTVYSLNESSQMNREERAFIPSTSPPSTLLSSTSTSPLASTSLSSLSPLPTSLSPASLEDSVHLAETTLISTMETSSSHPLGLPETTNSSTEGPANTPPSKLVSNFAPRETSADVEDTFNGGILDVYQYPTNMLPNSSRSKHGKVKIKSEEDREKAELKGQPGPEEREKVKNTDETLESVKVMQQDNSRVNLSLPDGNGAGHMTETLGPVMTSPLDNYTMDVATESQGRTKENSADAVAAYESGNSPVVDNVTIVSHVAWMNGSQSDVNGTLVSEREAVEEQADIEDAFKNDSLVIENKVEETVLHTTVEPFPLKNRVAAATSTQTFDQSQSGMNAGSVTGIVLGILVIFALFGAISFVLYRRRYLNKPQVLHDKCSNLDSSGYIDDASLRENSEEMYSLDNDSFLNSLEAMTIQNYWTESVKHTKL